jgi:hypothetical protein
VNEHVQNLLEAELKKIDRAIAEETERMDANRKWIAESEARLAYLRDRRASLTA